MGRRDRLEVIHDILRVIADNRNSILPTPLLRAANMSSSSFAEYYTDLVAKGLVKEECDPKGRKYVTLTDKGFRYIEKYDAIRGFIDEFGL
ncbi:TPA: winged helix DNA-binding protein [Candidatus Woesearchaeota archaeon]|nr:winged helix DNA-binding protein [Candidatus Woesearchaeota archaeon]